MIKFKHGVLGFWGFGVFLNAQNGVKNAYFSKIPKTGDHVDFFPTCMHNDNFPPRMLA